MDALLPKLLSFPPHPPPAQPLSDHSYDTQITTLIKNVKEIPDKQLLLQTSGGEDPLDVSCSLCAGPSLPLLSVTRLEYSLHIWCRLRSDRLAFLRS